MCPEPPFTPTVSAHARCGSRSAIRLPSGSSRASGGWRPCWRVSWTSCELSARPWVFRNRRLAGSPGARRRPRRTSISARSIDALPDLHGNVLDDREPHTQMTDRHVVVLAGGLTHEREVSLRSGSRLTEALRRHGLEVTVRDADAALFPWLVEHKPDAAVIALHGGRGENGAVQGVLELAGVPYLGTRSHDCRLSWDKPTAKTLVQRAGYRTPNWLTLSHNTFRDLGASALIDALVGHLGLPLMLKPHQGGSALGAS